MSQENCNSSNAFRDSVPSGLQLDEHWTVLWNTAVEAGQVRSHRAARILECAARARAETAPVTCAIPPAEACAEFSPLWEVWKHSSPNETSRRLLLDKPGEYSLLVCLPKHENTYLFDKFASKSGVSSKSRSQFCVQISTRVENAQGYFLRPTARLIWPPLAKSGSSEEDGELWVNPEHNWCCVRFSLSQTDAPATVSFAFDAHNAKSKLALLAELWFRKCDDVENMPKDEVPKLLGQDGLMPVLKTSGTWFVEETGGQRRVLLRGVNCGGNCKLPVTPDGATHLRQDYTQEMEASLSFVGRPFPLSEAREHLGRLQRWGFNCLRFLVNWEAVEHAGPGQYDYEYLEYVAEVVRMAGEYGLYVFIDPHQDVWSRMTGGSGAPSWTLRVAGLDIDALEHTGAAFTHATHPDGPAHFPMMSWPQNYQRFAAAHMFTLFFGGNDFAPEFMVRRAQSEGGGEEPIQDYLQRHYIDSMKEIAKRIAHLPNVVGFDSFNEPSAGFIGQHQLLQNTLGLRHFSKYQLGFRVCFKTEKE